MQWDGVVVMVLGAAAVVVVDKMQEWRCGGIIAF